MDADGIDEAEVEFTEHGEPIFDSELGYTSHFATCPNAGQHRRG